MDVADDEAYIYFGGSAALRHSPTAAAAAAAFINTVPPHQNGEGQGGELIQI